MNSLHLADLPVVLLHAFPLHSGMWEPQWPALGGRHVMAPDLPGFGAHPPGPRTLEGFAGTVLDAMDREGMERAVVVGLSMGGYVALRLHAMAPGRVAGLVLADTRAGADDAAGREKRTAQAARAREEGVGWMPDALLPLLLGETTRRERPQVVEEVRTMILEADPEGVARALEAMRERPDSLPDLPSIRVPARVLVGLEDTLTPPGESRALAERLANGRLEMLPGAGHLSNLEAPEAFNRALLAFLG